MIRTCVLCGKDFEVELEDKKTLNEDPFGKKRWSYKILTDCFYGGKNRTGIGMWAAYEWIGLDEKTGKISERRCISRWKELWYRLIDLKRLLLHQYEEWEYWECPTCMSSWDKEKEPYGRPLKVSLG